MAKKRRSTFDRIVIWLFTTLFSIATLVGGTCLMLYLKYQINVIDVYNQVKIISQPVDVGRLITNAYTEEDTTRAQEIIYVDSNGSCSINPEALIEIGLEKTLSLTDGEVGAMINYVMENQPAINVNFGKEINLKDYGFKVAQIDFSNIHSNKVDFNIVLKIDLNKVKEKMTNFPLNIIAKLIPSDLYISSTLTITKTSDFTYTTKSKGLVVNNLTKEQTDSLFKTVNTFIGIGTSSEFNGNIGNTFVNLLIGDDDNMGLAYGLYENHIVKQFTFEVVDEVEVFTITSSLSL